MSSTLTGKILAMQAILNTMSKPEKKICFDRIAPFFNDAKDMETLFDRYFEVDPHSFLTASEFKTRLAGHPYSKLKELKTWMALRHGIVRKRHPLKGCRIWVYSGVTVKEK